mmetsp:Transcript_22820/g.37555  ORF Transcript_22820/g.37555 Transcript_22820/m.37555 type:complete len:211 (+) Transcript_22820:270-902(+)
MLEHLRENGVALENRLLHTFLEGKNTTDNAAYALSWAKRLLKEDYTIIVVEESFLIRRVRATFLSRIESGSRVCVVNSHPSRALHSLLSLHDGRFFVVMHLLAAEIDRLFQYSSPNNEPFVFSRDDAFREKDRIKRLIHEREIWACRMALVAAHDYESGKMLMLDTVTALKFFAPRTPALASDADNDDLSTKAPKSTSHREPSMFSIGCI